MTIIRNINKELCLDNCVLGYGHFNTIHPGHIRYLKHEKSLGDKLVIALIGDNNGSKNDFKFNKNDSS